MNPEYPRLFVTDLDGTLLTDEKKISPATRKALDDFVSGGNIFAISSGRAMDSVLRLQKELQLDYPGSLVISCNGSHILDTGKNHVIFRTGVPLKMVSEIQKLAASMGVHCQTYTDTHIITPEINECIQFYTKFNRTPVLTVSDMASVMDEPPCKILGIDLYDHQKLDSFREAVIQRWGDVLTCIYSNPMYLEIINRDAGKGPAVTRICSYLHIPVENAMAAGDAENDISMLKAAGLGIAMCNGDPEVIRAADVVTAADNNHDGLVPFL